MPRYVLPAPPVVGLPVAGTAALFPVRRVYCVGRNYAAHAVEMGHDPDREPPFFFQKNPDNLDPSGRFPCPEGAGEVHHELELAVFLGAGGRDIPGEGAAACIFGHALALDMTLRDLQAAQKKAGRPWEVAKAFERSAPVGPIHPVAATGPLAAGRITLHVNGALRQEGEIGRMIWKVPEIIAHLSRHFVLAAGDVILTGTPAGVGPVAPGDRLDLAGERLGRFAVQVV
ncbi:fumarylacetoacetate hydrolase family protein [Albidovulum sp.]